MAFYLKIPLPAILNDAFVKLVAKLTDFEEVGAKAAEAAYPGAGDVVRAAYRKYEAPVSQALDAVAIVAKAAVELGDAARTLHAFAKPDPTDSA